MPNHDYMLQVQSKCHVFFNTQTMHVHLHSQLLCTSGYVPGVSKKVWYRKLQYFTNAAIYQWNIWKHSTYNFHLGVYKVSIQYVKGN